MKASAGTPQAGMQDRYYLDIGDKVTFSKTIGESDVYLFAGITGDLAPVHVNDVYMKQSIYHQRIAHGVLIMGFMSTTSSMIVAQAHDIGVKAVPVSLGYDHVRFVRAAIIGDTVTVHYEVIAINRAKARTTASIRVENQRGETIAVAEHILKWTSGS